MPAIEIREWTGGEPPWDLLLLADPSRGRVRHYLAVGECCQAYCDGKPVGVLVILEASPGCVEIMNLAVAPPFQGRGLGRQLVAKAKQRAIEQGARTLDVGTGNSSLGQLAFYQKCGFRICGVDRGFFTRHYDQVIEEDGIPCVDMIRLSMDLPKHE